MYSSNQYGTSLFGDYSSPDNLLVLINFRFRILEALMNNLRAITKANNFSVDISSVVIGDDGTEQTDKGIVISQLRDIAVIEYSGTTVNRNSFLIRSQTKLRNLYITFKLYVKNTNRSSIPDSEIEKREEYIDEIIKGLYGYNSNGQHLKDLLFQGISNDFGLVAYEISETKPYNLKQDLYIKFEALFQYRIKYY